MDNRFNEIKRKISALRTEMSVMEKAVRDIVSRDLDCTDMSLRLMAARADLAVLIRRWKEAGGGEGLSAVPERLRRSPGARGKAHRG
jgi:hypothetical protein